MNSYEKILQYFNFTPKEIDVNMFIVNAALVIVMALILEMTYRRCAQSLSNKSQFAYNFVMVSLITMLIITLVGSSVALSLGLVGALSIVRYRAAIKEPEELTYLFLTIGLGLGMGANQPIVTIIAFLIIVSIIWIRYFIRPVNKLLAYNMLVSLSKPKPGDMEKVIGIINLYFPKANLRRFDENTEILELAFRVKVKNLELLTNCKNEILKIENSSVSFVDIK
ncbi:MAG: DUF4956 domain-containing protein [Bacteroidales bacterium]|jgi:hypothetical protein|nr:DUF4956 domain-containing protein [Bacteroidales bacterium]HOL98666.1 DUF4956 domain-containing protein [Bacteroidales bacterium]HOM35913.1 DUF4956 domain-containing protein [Bacteroidales bacterium]HPD24485.1 DUF4956 domain-containing protein [Bacteroidales bacterium]HRT00305.1 DUF4956 domain-containing protein [Bacteroidales bacterium]